MEYLAHGAMFPVTNVGVRPCSYIDRRSECLRAVLLGSSADAFHAKQATQLSQLSVFIYTTTSSAVQCSIFTLASQPQMHLVTTQIGCNTGQCT